MQESLRCWKQSSDLPSPTPPYYISTLENMEDPTLNVSTFYISIHIEVKWKVKFGFWMAEF
jgi:hypothetical protein